MQDAIIAGVVVAQAVCNLRDDFGIDVVQRLSDVGNRSRVWSPEGATL